MNTPALENILAALSSMTLAWPEEDASVAEAAHAVTSLRSANSNQITTLVQAAEAERCN